MDPVVKGWMIFFFLFLVAMFSLMVYYIWYRPYQCNHKGADGDVATWSWDNTDGKCYPASCTSGTLDKDKHTCNK